MASVTDALQGKTTQLSSVLEAGLEALSLTEQVTFTQYTLIVLPTDACVFWVKSSALTPASPLFAGPLNVASQTAQAGVTAETASITVTGSFHVAASVEQSQEQSIGINRVTFTCDTELPIKDFNATGPYTMYIATYQGVRFSFSARGGFYKVANLYHYTGTAVYPDTAIQIVDDPTVFNAATVVSNSLPFWIGFNGYNPAWPAYFKNTIPVYPSFEFPFNLTPPYVSVHIEPSSTVGLTALPVYDNTFNQQQLAQETVTLTMTGLRSDQAQDFMACVYEYSLNTNNFGINNMPIVRDEKRVQEELGAIAQRKSVVLEINYLQSRARTIARQLILSAFQTYGIIK